MAAGVGQVIAVKRNVHLTMNIDAGILAESMHYFYGAGAGVAAFELIAAVLVKCGVVFSRPPRLT